MSWLPPQHPAEPVSERPWQPPFLQQIDVASLLYVVVEEILEDMVNLLVSDWPTLDGNGRLRFGDEPPVGVTAAREVLERFLAEHRLPAELRERPLRTGDTFAVRALTDPRTLIRTNGGPLDPAAWIAPPVYDISADARDVAKVAFYGAVTPTLDSEQAARLEKIVESRSELPPAGRPPQPEPRLSLRWLGASAVVGLVGIGAGIAVTQAIDGGTTIAGETSTVTSVSTTSVTRTETSTETSTATVTTEPPPTPDLTVSILPDGIDSTSCPGPNCLTGIGYVVANVGGADITQPFDVSITSEAPNRNTGPQMRTVTKTVDELAAGALLFSSDLLPRGADCYTSDCTITIETDSSGLISEANEENNTATGSPTIVE